MEKIIELIKKNNGERVFDLKEDVYYLVLKDAVVSMYLDQYTKTLKIDVEVTPEEKTFVYFENELSLEDLI